jgi:hypothetical protein
MSENTAKQRLITSLETYIEEKSKSAGVLDQGSVMFALDVLDDINALNLMQCQKLENLIIKTNVESQGAALKYGWGYEPIHPMDFGGFIEDIL